MGCNAYIEYPDVALILYEIRLAVGAAFPLLHAEESLIKLGEMIHVKH